MAQQVSNSKDQNKDQIQYEAGLASIQNRLGNIYFRLNERQQAEKKYKDACRIFDCVYYTDSCLVGGIML